MDVTFTTTTDALFAASQVLTQSLQRGDFDDDPAFETAAAVAAGRFSGAAYTADENNQTTGQVTVPLEHLDEILAVLESDTRSVAALTRLSTDACAALDRITPDTATS